MRPVIAFQGLNGSGKTTHSRHVATFIGSFRNNPYATASHTEWDDVQNINIKHQIWDVAGAITKKLPLTLNVEQTKQLLLAVSTWGEMFVDEMIWSDMYVKHVLNTCGTKYIITDDIRTDFNLKALNKIVETRPVYLICLEASEENRKSRSSAWRSGDSYTEQPPNWDLLDERIDRRVLNTDGPEEVTREVLNSWIEEWQNLKVD